MQDVQALADAFSACRKLLLALGDENRQHLRIWKDAVWIKSRREGTKNDDYFNPDAAAIEELLQMITHVKRMTESLSDRSGEKDERMICYGNDGTDQTKTQRAAIQVGTD